MCPTGEGIDVRARRWTARSGCPLEAAAGGRPDPGERRRSPTSYVTGGDALRAVRRRGHPRRTRTPSGRPPSANVTGLLAAIAPVRARAERASSSAALARRFTTPAPPADRGVARPGRGRPEPARADRPGPGRLVRAGRARGPVQRHGRPARGERRDHPPRPRPEPRLPGRRVARAAHAAGGAAHVQRAAPGGAGDDPDARAEFLESSGQQIERLDWLAQNLLELSKLDSGLVLLDLRPDDLRAAVESAVEQSAAAARKRGITLTLHLPTRRSGSATTRSGSARSSPTSSATPSSSRRAAASVAVDARRHRRTAPGSRSPTPASASTPAELPHIFERFYRGSRANEARGSGSGLGLAIVRSIVDMHGGRSRSRAASATGSRFTVTLPRDPRLVGGHARPRVARRDVGDCGRCRDPARDARAQRDGNFTVRAPAGEPGACTLGPHEPSRPLTGRHLQGPPPT